MRGRRDAGTDGQDFKFICATAKYPKPPRWKTESYIHAYIHTYIHTYIHAYIHIHAKKYIYIYIKGQRNCACLFLT